MTEQNPSTPQPSDSTPTQPVQPVASTSTAPQTTTQPAATSTSAAATSATQPALNNEMLAIVQALVRMQNGGQIDPANTAVQHLYQLVKTGKLNQQQLLQVLVALYFVGLVLIMSFDSLRDSRRQEEYKVLLQPVLRLLLGHPGQR